MTRLTPPHHYIVTCVNVDRITNNESSPFAWIWLGSMHLSFVDHLYFSKAVLSRKLLLRSRHDEEDDNDKEGMTPPSQWGGWWGGRGGWWRGWQWQGGYDTSQSMRRMMRRKRRMMRRMTMTRRVWHLPVKSPPTAALLPLHAPHFSKPAKRCRENSRHFSSSFSAETKLVLSNSK